MGTINSIALGVYLLLTLGIGLQTMRRIKTPGDFAVAGNRIIWPVLFATLAATFLGGGATIGRAGESYTIGYAFAVAACAFPIQTILVGTFIAPRLKRYPGVETVGGIMEIHYGRPARLLTGIISMVYCTGVLGAQALALGTIFHTIIGTSVTTGILIGMIFVLVYSTAGGMWADVQTDVLQFLMLGTFLPLALILGVREAGGVEGLVNAVPDGHLNLFGAYDVMAFLGIFLAFLLGECLIPPYTQRALSAPDAGHARKGYALAGVFGFFFYFVSASLGLVALVLFPGIAPDQALPTIVREALPVGIAGLVAASLLAVVMSTADSLLNSSTVAFANDIYKPFINPHISQSRLLWLERGGNVVIGLGALVFALSAKSIVDALLYSYSLWAPTIIIPFLFAVLTRRSAPRAGTAAMLVGGVVTAYWTWGLGEPNGVTGLMVGLVANAVTFALVYLVFDKTRGAVLEVAA
jgi:solute:Na+ symporter, SSS family